MAITAGLTLIAIAMGFALSASESTDAGKRVESESFTAPMKVASCITYNINKKKPELLVRNRPSDSSDGSIYLVLTNIGETPTTFGVIRINDSGPGSHLTTWLPSRSVADHSPNEVSERLIAGC